MKEVSVSFNNDSTDTLPIYAKYPDQYLPQSAYITLDLRDGTIDADYSAVVGGGMLFSVWNNVVIRFPLDPCLTGESIIKVIDKHKDELQAFYNISGTEMDFRWNEIGISIDKNVDSEDWMDKIRYLQNSIKEYSHKYAVWVADDDMFNDSINLTPPTSNLTDYATSVLDSIKENCFVENAMDDNEVVSRLIMEMYVNNTESLNKNGMEMLLANIDDYANQIGYDRDDIDRDDIEAAMKRA